MTETLHAHGATLGVGRVSAALGVPRASAYRWRQPPALPRERDGAAIECPHATVATQARTNAPRYFTTPLRRALKNSTAAARFGSTTAE